eukprot:scaffold458878_cov33-Prasinocladus_malaysianus.AAC.2
MQTQDNETVTAATHSYRPHNIYKNNNNKITPKCVKTIRIAKQAEAPFDQQVHSVKGKSL